MTNTSGVFESLEAWSSKLFFLASVILFATAAYRGSAYLIESITYSGLPGNAMLFGRLAALLGVGGLTVEIAKQSSRLGKVSRVLVSLAVAFALILWIVATLNDMGITTALYPLFGLGTAILSLLTYEVVGIAIIRTGVHSKLIGSLLVVAGITLIALLVGLQIFPKGLIGTIGEGTLFMLYFAMGYRLRIDHATIRRDESMADTTL